jgi:hypothetical protein
MTTAATSLLGLALPVTGELSGTWGDTVNNSITALLDSAVAGTTTLSADADVTLTTTTLAANQAREAIILWTAGGTVTRNITAPAQSKTYVVLNKTSSTQSIVIRGAGPTTGVTVLAGKQAMVAWDGTDFVEVSSGYVDGPASSTDNAVARFDGTDGKLIQNSVVIIADTTGNMSGVGTLSSGAITSSSLTATRVLFAGTAGLIQDDADLTFNGTILTSTGFAGPLNGTVGATTPAAGAFTTLSTTGAVTITGGTANGVAYLNGSKVLTTGSALTFDGSTLGVLTSNALTLNVSSSNASATLVQHTNSNASADLFYRFRQNGGGGNFYDLTMEGATNAFTIDYNDSERFRITSGGDVGIGTSSPGYKLDVLGNARIQQSNFTDTILRLATGASTTGNLNQILFQDQGTNTTASITAYNTAYGSGKNYALGFTTNGTERMLLDSSGNLGLGVTPSAWLAGSQAFQNGGGSVFQYDNARIFVGQNTYIDSAAADRFIGNGYATRYRQFQGEHAFFISTVSNSSGAGASQSLTQAMTLDASGNFMVGTTSNPSSPKFRVNGISAFGGSNTNIYQGELSSTATYIQSLTVGGAAADLVFYNTSERARIDSSGNLLVGTTSGGNGRIEVYGIPDALPAIKTFQNATTSQQAIAFGNPNGVVGTITTSGSATLYNTTSDYRLKNITGPITTSGAYIDSLKPVEGTWRADGSAFVGLIAHETQEVSRTAVATGTKDGEQTQGMDYSSAEIIANLIAEIQSLRKRLAAAGI